MSIDLLFDELEKTRTTWVSMYDLFIQAKYDVSGSRPVIQGQSMEDLHRRTAYVIESIAALRPNQPNSTETIVFKAKSNEIKPILQNLSSHSEAIQGQIRPYWQEGLAIKDVNGNFTVQLVRPDNVPVAPLDLSAYFIQINQSLNQLMSQLAELLPLCKSEGAGDLSQRAIAMADIVREIGNLRTQAQKSADAAATNAANAAKKDKIVQTNADQVTTALTTIQTVLNQANTNAGNVTALVEKIKATGANSDSLEKQIADYQSSFDAFQKQLADKNQQFVEFQKADKDAKEANGKREEEIDRLTKLADKMISGASTVGLAKSMEDTRVRYEARMVGARRGFWAAVALLVASALPLAAHLLPGLVGSWIPAFDAKADGSAYAVIGKIVLLLPATWLTAFFTKSYAEFFHLEREYAHKAALAMSVDGFKRQAPKYEEEITAEVFMEIRNNPGRGQSVEPASHPLYDVLSKVVSKFLTKNKEEKD
jgi:hypothetical protein